LNDLFFDRLVLAWILLALIIFPVIFKINAPYGRHFRKAGPSVDNKLGWVLMEIPSPVVFSFFFLTGSSEKTAASWILAGCWVFHYGYRILIFSQRLRTTGKRMPLAIMSSAIWFNLVNGFLNGYGLGTRLKPLPDTHLVHPTFLLGALLFVLGFAMHVVADNYLRGLRQPGETGYKIPQAGLYRLVSSPNYLGEIVEWTGFALMAMSLPALSFLLWTCANLVPRARANHRWYGETFPDYPQQRKALVPYLW